jgi:Zn-dependent peptidase ImmA (M78 family)
MRIRQAILDKYKEQFLTFQQLAEAWGVSKQAVRTKMIRWGLYRKHPLLGCYVERDKLREYLENLDKKIKGEQK